MLIWYPVTKIFKDLTTFCIYHLVHKMHSIINSVCAKVGGEHFGMAALLNHQITKIFVIWF